jgi:hypothetical protein
LATVKFLRRGKIPVFGMASVAARVAGRRADFPVTRLNGEKPSR